MTAAERFDEHKAGWLLFDGDRMVADLAFCGTDYPFYLFRVTLPTGKKDELLILASTSRPVLECLSYKNKTTGVVVRDAEFVTNFYNTSPDYSVICLRDFRLPGEPGSSGERC